MKKLFTLIIATVVLAIPLIKILPNPKEPPHKTPEPVITQKVEAQSVTEAPKTQDPVQVTPQPITEEVADPNNCESQGMHYRADNKECIPNTAPAQTVSAGSGSCEAEIAKYDWVYSVAVAVATAESSLDPSRLNDNPSTGDYSVGCFQINLYGGNARNRPSEAELKNAAVNVAFAYQIYVGNGHSFIGQWGVCRSRVACY
jgi:hypothetical protein